MGGRKFFALPVFHPSNLPYAKNHVRFPCVWDVDILTGVAICATLCIAMNKPFQPVVPTSELSHNPCTLRSIAVGAIGCLIIGVGTTYNIMVIHGSYMAIDFSAAAAIFVFFVLTFIINAGAGRLSARFALTGAELRTVYMMLAVACAIPTMGYSAQLLPIITAPFYFATPENNWAELIQPHIKPWLAPQSPLDIKYFYEGLPSWEDGIPWAIWMKPLLVWGSFALALYLVMVCMMVILRRQWMEHERLVYPLAQLPMEMAAPSGQGALSPLFKNRLLWLGFGIAFLTASLKGLHFYNPAIPHVELEQSIPIFKNTETLFFRFSFPMLGFCYLVNPDVAFSMWFFNLLSLMVRGGMAYFGYRITENLGIYGSPSPLFKHLGMGAMIVLVVAGLWSAKAHLKEVFRKALFGKRTVDDSDEILSYRASVWGMLLGLIYMGFWLHASGIPALMVAVFLFAVFVIFIGLTRIVVESGMAVAVASTIGSSYVISGFGANRFGASGVAGMALTYVWSADVRTFVMASVANGLKVVDDPDQNKCRLFSAIMLAIIVSMISSIWMLLWLSYTHGGLNGNGWFYGGGAKAPYNYIITLLMSPPDVNWLGWWIQGIGGAIMGLLMFLRSQFLWFPLHPIGFVIGPIWLMDRLWFTVFLAWLIKACILKYGGLGGYRRARPLFLGLILGQFTCNGFWIIIDLLTGQKGNSIFWI